MLNTRNRARAALTSTLLVVLTLTASPAYGADRDSAPDACWLNADTSVVQCFDDSTALDAAVLAQTGGKLVRLASASEKPAGVLAIFTMAEFYINASYGGSFYTVSSSSSTICTTGIGQNGNLTGIFNNSVSSLKTYIGCQAKLYDGAGLTGATYGPVTTTPGVGAFNDRASSFRVD
ncbi:MAG: hypothetical protein ABI566_04635 [Pseudolysinimonas sp.]